MGRRLALLLGGLEREGPRAGFLDDVPLLGTGEAERNSRRWPSSPGCGSCPLPHLLQLSGPYRPNEHQRCPVAEETRVGEWGVSAARPVVVPLLRAALASLPPGRAPPLPPARAGARCSSLLLWWGELTLSSRLGSLTQIRHDKEGESGTWAEPRRGGCG